MSTFKTQSQVYHLTVSLLSSPEDGPWFMQMYFMSEEVGT